MTHNTSINPTKTIIIPAALKLKEACAYLGGISPVTVRRLIDRGKLRRHPSLRHIVITKASLDKFLSEADVTP